MSLSSLKPLASSLLTELKLSSMASNTSMELVFKLWWQRYYFKLFLPPSLSSHTSSVFCVLYIFLHSRWFHPVQLCSVAQPYLTLCDPMDCNKPGFSVLHYLLEFVQIHVHWVGDAILLTWYKWIQGSWESHFFKKEDEKNNNTPVSELFLWEVLAINQEYPFKTLVV